MERERPEHRDYSFRGQVIYPALDRLFQCLAEDKGHYAADILIVLGSILPEGQRPEIPEYNREDGTDIYELKALAEAVGKALGDEGLTLMPMQKEDEDGFDEIWERIVANRTPRDSENKG